MITQNDIFDDVRSSLRGVIPILVSPFDALGELDLRSLDRQVEYLAERGSQWMGIGFGSEIQKLSPSEALTLIERPNQHTTGSVRMIGNADTTSIWGARSTLTELAAAGASAVLLRPPALGGLDDAALFDIFHAVSVDSPLPVIVQDAAAMTGLDLSIALLERLLTEIPTIVAVKIESRGAVRKIADLRSRLSSSEGVILGGSGGAEYYWELDRGADGTMPGPATPEYFTAIEIARKNSDHETARSIQRAVLPLLVLGERNMDTFVYSQKFILHERGVISNPRLRIPNALDNTTELDRDLSDVAADLDRFAFPPAGAS